MDTQRQDELAYEQTGDLYSHLQAQSIELAKLREENRELREALYEALTVVLINCSCDGDYDCDRCDKTLKRRAEVKQLEGE